MGNARSASIIQIPKSPLWLVPLAKAQCRFARKSEGRRAIEKV
jgi:hypothetical protein